ncbi:MAG: hypothetical protein JSS07_02650 [Proteobacteria bacterium]|nr:hypothetical protein [Pseudomonadota bacterium]
MRFFCMFSLFFVGFFGLLSPVSGRVDAPFCAVLQNNLIKQIEYEKESIQDPELKAFAYQVWQEIALQGFSVQSGKTDKMLRTTFNQIQAKSEALFLANLANIGYGKAIWIIHTPLVATPLVTEGKVSKDLISADILADKDKTRVNTVLERAHIMRDFLAKGGVIIVAYQSPKESNQNRTPTQLRIFNALKKQYPQQLIEFAMNLKGQFPNDKIGATYLMQMNNQEVIEMSIRGHQINQSKDDGVWGLWLQERNHPCHETGRHLNTIFQFLNANGFKEVLKQHALSQGISQEELFAVMAPYIS